MPPQRDSVGVTQEKSLTFYSRKDPGVKARFVERLKKFGLPVSGSLDALANRDRELVIKWNANLDAAVPKSEREVAKSVSQAEKYLEREERKRAHHTSVAKHCFFSSKRVRIQSPNQHVPAEGDDFDTLIRKLKRAKKDAKRRTEEAGEESSAKAPKGGAEALDVSVHVATEHGGPPAESPLPTGSISLPDLPSPPSVPSSSADSDSMIDVPLEQDNFSPQHESCDPIIKRDTLSVDQDEATAVPPCERKGDVDSIQEEKQQSDEPQVLFATLDPTRPIVMTGAGIAKPDGARALPVHQDEVMLISPVEKTADMTTIRRGEQQLQGPNKVHAVFDSTQPSVEAGTSVGEADRAPQEKQVTPLKQLATLESRTKSTGVEATSLLRSAFTASPTAATPPSATGIGASQRTTQATTTPNSTEQKEEQSLRIMENNGTEPGQVPCSAIEDASTKDSTHSQLHAFGRSGSLGQDTHQGHAGLTEEQKQRIEFSRKIALERKRKFLERRQRQRLGQMRQPDLS